jgi:cytidylate kinase
MIVALSGPACSGKATIAAYLSEALGFQIKNMYQEYAKMKQLDENTVSEDLIL